MLLEALTIGLLGSVVGIVAGLGFAKAINALFKALGIDLPTTGLVLESRTIIVCLLVGTIVTLVGALAPAVRATRVAPVEALREASAPTRGRLARLTPWLAGLLHPRRRRARRRGPARRGRRHVDQAARRRGRRGDPDPRHRADLAALRRPRGALVAVAGRALHEARRPARARELDAPPRPHGGHLGGADDRARARRLRHHLRQRPARLDLRPDRPHAGRRHRGAARRRLHARSRPRSGRRWPRSPGVAAVSSFRDTQSRDQGRRAARKLTHAIDPATVGQVYNFDWKDGSQKSLRRARRTTVSCSRRTSPTDGDFKVGDKVADHRPERQRRR